MVANLPQNYQKDVEAALNELDNDPLPQRRNPIFIKANNFKIRVASGNVEIIYGVDIATKRVRIIIAVIC
jgi:hypothetical protein